MIITIYPTREAEVEYYRNNINKTIKLEVEGKFYVGEIKRAEVSTKEEMPSVTIEFESEELDKVMHDKFDQKMLTGISIKGGRK